MGWMTDFAHNFVLGAKRLFEYSFFSNAITKDLATLKSQYQWPTILLPYKTGS